MTDHLPRYEGIFIFRIWRMKSKTRAEIHIDAAFRQVKLGKLICFMCVCLCACVCVCVCVCLPRVLAIVVDTVEFPRLAPITSTFYSVVSCSRPHTRISIIRLLSRCKSRRNSNPKWTLGIHAVGLSLDSI